MQAYLLTKTLFKTIEYKLLNSDSLTVSEITTNGSNSKSILLGSVNIEEGQSLPSFAPWLTLSSGISLIGLCIYFSQFSSLLEQNLMNAVFFLATITGALVFLCKPEKVVRYRDIYSNNVLLKLKSDKKYNRANDQFITSLNAAIVEAKEEESNKINLKTNAKLQYETQHKNVDDLFNLGLIDEALYNRICNSMQEKVFGKINQHVSENNVIYLNR